MRGSDARSGELFSYMDLEKRVPAEHPLRLVRRVVNDVLAALDGDFSKVPGYAVSQQKRKRIQEPFGWSKTIGGLARPMLRGVKKLGFKFTLTMAGYNLIRLPKLLEAAA